MSEGVKPRRRYDSTRRREQAQRTRAAIVDRARQLFLERGYTATTMASVAEGAGVSVETVYKAFGNKARLLKGAFDVAIVGDHQPVPMLQRELVRRIDAEPDPSRKLSMYGEHLAEAGPRAGALQLVARAAAANDPEAADVWDQMVAERLTGMTQFARHLHEGGYLRPDVSVEEARDILWTFNSVELYDLLVIQRGWATERYGRWIAEALIAALLPSAARL
jgi:AcrR family transcriptional regulator